MNNSGLEVALWKRFDVFIKLMYVKEHLKGDVSPWVNSAYLEHIDVFNGFCEPGQKNKNSPLKFIQSFDSLISSMKLNGFDAGKGLIPIDNNGVPQNGAHRLSVAMALNIDIDIEETNSDGFVYDYRFFKMNGLSESVMDAAALEFIKFYVNSTVFVVYPAAEKHFEIIDGLFRKEMNAFYSKDVFLSSLGSVNAIRTMYEGELWLGNGSNDFYGARSKASECFPNNEGTARVYLVNTTQDEALKFKTLLREKIKLGKHSLHCSDTHEEARNIGELFLNNNSVNHMNFSTPAEFPDYLHRLLNFKEWLNDNDIDRDSVCVGGSSVMTSYGLRDSKDLDFIHLENIPAVPNNGGFDSHNKESFLFGIPLKEIISDPNNYFYSNGIKHVSIPLLQVFKGNRGELKDIEDIKMMSFISKGIVPKTRLKLKHRMRIMARQLKFKLKRIISYFN